MNFFNKNENMKMVTPMFRGTFDDFYTFINDYVKNKVPYQTKRHKPEHCELCGEKKTLEAAHVRNRDRRVLMQEAFDEIAIPEENGIFAVDLNKYADKIGQMHSDPHNFHFLCRDCHKKYDAPGSTIQETDFRPRNNINKVKINRVKTQTSKGKEMNDMTWLKEKLKTVGKGTFKGCYDAYAKNYMKLDKSDLEEAIEQYGKSTGYTYKKTAVQAKKSAGCAIFREGMQQEALKLCE